jgi:putative hydrolase of the HAD superfamily
MLIDLDDTIVTYGVGSSDAWRQACERHAPSVGLDPAAVCAAIDEYFDWFWGDAERHRIGRLDLQWYRLDGARQAVRRLGCDRADVGEAIGRMYCELREASLVAFEGALETLDELRRRGVKLTLLTNGGSDLQRPKIERFDLARRFDHVQVEGEVGFGKPEHRAYLHAVEQIGSTPGETWIVGDNLEWEVTVPQQLGFYAVWHDHLGRGLEGRDVRPDRIVHRLSELLD